MAYKLYLNNTVKEKTYTIKVITMYDGIIKHEEVKCKTIKMRRRGIHSYKVLPLYMESYNITRRYTVMI